MVLESNQEIIEKVIAFRKSLLSKELVCPRRSSKRSRPATRRVSDKRHG